MAQRNEFRMKVYGFPAFARDFLTFNRDMPAFIASRFQRKISMEFEERIMLTVSSVNGCKYCSWLHSQVALKAGIDQDEIKRLLSLQLSRSVGDGEFAALNFAVHYAETDKQPHPELERNLFDHYGDGTASEILRTLQRVYFGTLCGNTFKAFLSRLRGVKAEGSFWLTEMVISLIVLPMFGPISLLTERSERRKQS